MVCLCGVILNVHTCSNTQRKVGFLVIDLTWKLFSQTGNIETYLLMKELENTTDTPNTDIDTESRHTPLSD